MQLFSEWFKSDPSNASKQWLLLGKGPTFSRRDEFDLTKYKLLGLNHVPCAIKVDLCHAIDIEVLQQAGEEIERNSSFLVMPWFPNSQMKKCAKELSQWIEEIPTLKKMDDENRLLWYDLEESPFYRSDEKPIQVRFFSSEAAIHLLAAQNVKQIRTLGIDGGNAYSSTFRDIEDANKLVNGQPSFDVQFQQIARLISEYDLEFFPLTNDGPIKVFVGASDSEWLPFKVLEYSLKKNARMSVQCIPLSEAKIDIPMPKDEANRPRTPFSFHRFLIPQLCDYKGKAIYLDSDMLVLNDIRQIWELPFDGSQLLAINPVDDTQKNTQFAVMMLNCETLDWRIGDIVKMLDSGALNYHRLMQEMEVARKVSAKIPHTWNCLDKYHRRTSSLIHFTDMVKQPWVSRFNPLGWLWMSYLMGAIEADFVSIQDLNREISLGNIRPSLIRQIEENIADPLLLGGDGIRDDLEFEPPYTRIGRPKPLGARLLAKLGVHFTF
jgi:Glycosyl transferase family 8.